MMRHTPKFITLFLNSLIRYRDELIAMFNKGEKSLSLIIERMYKANGSEVDLSDTGKPYDAGKPKPKKKWTELWIVTLYERKACSVKLWLVALKLKKLCRHRKAAEHKMQR